MTMDTPPLQLDWSFYERVLVDTNEEYDSGAQSVIIGNASVRVVGSAEDKTKFKATLRVDNLSQKESDDNPPLFYDVIINGFFTLREDCLDKAAPYLHITGASMLYGSVREMLMILSGRFENGQGAVLLPTIDPRTGFTRDEDDEG